MDIEELRQQLEIENLYQAELQETVGYWYLQEFTACNPDKLPSNEECYAIRVTEPLQNQSIFLIVSHSWFDDFFKKSVLSPDKLSQLRRSIKRILEEKFNYNTQLDLVYQLNTHNPWIFEEVRSE